MKIEMKTTVLVEVTKLQVIAGVRYWCDATVNGKKGDDDNPEDDGGIPFREGDTWCPSIDVDTGIIEHWPQGTTASVHYKVCDQFSAHLFDSNGLEVAKMENEYVPGFMCPKERGYGDYIIMDIDADGKIDGWEFDSSYFTREDD